MIGWGIIGVGDVTEVKAAPSVFRVPDSDVVHVMRRDADRAADFARRHGVERWSTDAAAVLEDPAVTAVYVATPTSTHSEYAIAAARAGKHVLVEKPMAMSTHECRAMIDAAEDAGVHLWVAYYRRSLPRFEHVRDLLDDGVIGRVLAVDTTWRKPCTFEGWRWDPALNRGGEFQETACHTLDILDHLLGPASNAVGVATGDARAVAGSWRHGEVLASGSWTLGTPLLHDETVLVGSEGTISFATFSPTPLRVETSEGRRDQEVHDPPHVHGPLVASILEELRGIGTCPSHGTSGLRANELAEALLAPSRSAHP